MTAAPATKRPSTARAPQPTTPTEPDFAGMFCGALTAARLNRAHELLTAAKLSYAQKQLSNCPTAAVTAGRAVAAVSEGMAK